VHGQDWVQKLPKSWKEEGGLYNPINGKIEDEKRLWERDLKEKNKRKRFELKYDMEKQLRKQGLQEEERLEKIGVNKINVQRFKDTTFRGFDILTNKQFNNPTDQGSKTLYEPVVKDPPSAWTKIKNFSNGFDDFQTDQSTGHEEEGSEPKKLDDNPTSEDFNDRVLETNSEFLLTKSNIDRRSQRLAKGSKTMSNFHKTNAIRNPPKIQNPPYRAQNYSVEPSQPIKTNAAPPNLISKSLSSMTPAHRESNQSALRKNVAGSNRHSQVGAGASKTGRNVIGHTPKSQSVASSGRAIRTGAFQRLKA
jgi:hypothetical protein